jgi:predicted ribosome quality control (RQC) complex YloA/Tae2 family protein
MQRAKKNPASSVKVRFDGLDVTAMVSHVQRRLLGRKIINVYDGDNGETYVFKLDSSGGTTISNNNNNTSNSKEFLLLESGIRFHPLEHFESNLPMPTPFCAKLRKHLRGLRLEQISQIGTDRVILLQFGSGASRHALILELYAKGNIILTEGIHYTILALLRSHVYEKDQVAVQVGQVYPVTYATSVQKDNQTVANAVAATDTQPENDPSPTSRIMDTACAAKNKRGILNMSIEEIQASLALLLEPAPVSATTKKGKKGSPLNLKTLLLQPQWGVSQYGPALLEHCILQANLLPHASIKETVLQAADWERLQTSLSEQGPAIMYNLHSAAIDTPGYILYQPRVEEDIVNGKPHSENLSSAVAVVAKELAHADKVLLEFQPHLLAQHQNCPRLEYKHFGAAVADFFAHMVAQKRLLKVQASEMAVQEKLRKVQQDQADRVMALERDQQTLQAYAQVVKNNAENVDKALLVINSALDSGMDWDQLIELVSVEQANRNPIANLIVRLELENEIMILRLPRDPFDELSDVLNVNVSLKDSAHANASALFAKYRASKEKTQKTLESSSKALQAAEESAQRQLIEAQRRTKQTVAAVKRKPAWYEKFHWFVTSDNYLVLGGKDAHQNELLVKRYLRAGDAYLHAEVHGAASCILRAKRRRLPNGATQSIPLSDQALREAGNFTICRSSAWASRMVTSAWWVESHQVSKTAPSGEFLTVGSFMVRGKKNFLPPSPLEMGLAVLFRLGDDDSIARHKTERRDFALIELENSSVDVLDAVSSFQMEPKTNIEGQEATTHRDTTEHEGSDLVSDEVWMTLPKVIVSNSTSSSENLINDPTRDDGSCGSDGNEEAKKGSTTNEGNGRRKKKGLSVKERKQMKKYGSLGEARKLHSTVAVDKSSTEDTHGQQPVLPSLDGLIDASKLKRGKRAKAKRAMLKYMDQDDEDRELAMLALQGGEGKNRKKGKNKRSQGPVSAAQSQVAGETAALLVRDTSETIEQLPGQVVSILQECLTANNGLGKHNEAIRWDKLDSDTVEQLVALESLDAQVAAATRLLNLKTSTRVDNFSASLGGIIRTIRKYGYSCLDDEKTEVLEKPKRKTKAQKDVESTQWKQTMEEEGVVGSDLDEDAVDDTIELSKLSGMPQAEDLVLYAVPVCAPYQTLSKYTYRVKLTPGSTKRGKAVKQCVDMFLKNMVLKEPSASEHCTELIKKLGDNDWVQVICADVKISAPGASKTAKKHRAITKKKNK